LTIALTGSSAPTAGRVKANRTKAHVSNTEYLMMTSSLYPL
jgi:hypothetical protein